MVILLKLLLKLLLVATCPNVQKKSRRVSLADSFFSCSGKLLSASRECVATDNATHAHKSALFPVRIYPEI